LFNKTCVKDCKKNKEEKKIIDLLSNRCVQICSTGFKNIFSAELDQEICIQCNNHCIKCESSDVCLRCSEDFYLFENKCIKSCQKGYYGIKAERKCSRCKEGEFEVNSLEETAMCKTCNNECLTCSENENYCTSCKQKLYAHLGKCEKECPKEFYPQEDISKCEPCPIECLQCHAKDNCSLCRGGFFLYRGVCLEVCPERTFQVMAENKCEDCHLTCRYCIGPSHRDCKNNCWDTRNFFEETLNNNKEYNESTTIKGRCECKKGYFEEQEPNCGGNLIIFF
jgi:hypothetical protein